MSKMKIYTQKVINYKGHSIRICEDDFGYDIIVIDNDASEIETAPIAMKDVDFRYCSLTDAKRMISGLVPKFSPFDIVDYEPTRERYYKRFSK